VLHALLVALLSFTGAGLEKDINALELNDRAADIWKPLFAIARAIEDAGLWQTLTSLAVEMGRDPDADARARRRAVIQALRRCMNGEEALVGTTTELLVKLNKGRLCIVENEVGTLLGQWGFAQESIRLAQGPRRAWRLPNKRLAEIERENQV
jgi:uncharacterized protein DUF3631